MIKKRRRFSAAKKAKIALEAVKGIRPINEIAKKVDGHPRRVNKWRKELVDCLPEPY